jgi:hypothetical protein
LLQSGESRAIKIKFESRLSTFIPDPQDEDIRTNIHSHRRVHPLPNGIDWIDPLDWVSRRPNFSPTKEPKSQSLIFRNIPTLPQTYSSGNAMSVTMPVSKNALKKRLPGVRRNLPRWVVQCAVLVSVWLEECSPFKVPLIQIISRDGSPFSMDVFRKVYDVPTLNASSHVDKCQRHIQRMPSCSVASLETLPHRRRRINRHPSPRLQHILPGRPNRANLLRFYQGRNCLTDSPHGTRSFPP